jgi:hypothetical protein
LLLYSRDKKLRGQEGTALGQSLMLTLGFKHETNAKGFLNLSSYVTENTKHMYCRDKPVTALRCNNHTVRENVGFLMSQRMVHIVTTMLQRVNS